MSGALEDSILVEAPPESVWNWLTGLAGHYTEWHPDHHSAEWILGEPTQVGSVLRAVEDVGGHREMLDMEVTRIERPRRIEYRIRGLHGLVLPGGAFVLEPVDGYTLFTASVRYRFGRITGRLFRKRMVGLQQHMRQEGENLRALVEARPVRSARRSS